MSWNDLQFQIPDKTLKHHKRNTVVLYKTYTTNGITNMTTYSMKKINSKIFLFFSSINCIFLIKKRQFWTLQEEVINMFNSFSKKHGEISSKDFLNIFWYTLFVVQQLLISYLLRAVSKCVCWRAVPVSFGMTTSRLCRRLQTADKRAGVTTACCLDRAADVGESCWLGDSVMVVSLWPRLCWIKKNPKQPKDYITAVT